MKKINFKSLSTEELIVDAIYEGGEQGNVGDDPIGKVLPGIGNMGGFRAAGRGSNKDYVVLYTSGESRDWPDTIDLTTGKFTYYGDNKTPGHELHDTPRKGNLILKNVFDCLHSSCPDLTRIPPFLVFIKFPTPNSERSVQFKGLAVPGHPGIPPTEDLVAVWKTTGGQRFQNYKAIFTILNIPKISRAWIDDLRLCSHFTENTPAPWKKWIEKGVYSPLQSEPTTIIRSISEQTPSTALEINILRLLYEYFKDASSAFEVFAAHIFRMHDSRILIDEITRGSVDGGRDAIGRYVLGLNNDPVYIEFSLEAKCYRPPLEGWQANTVGVKEVSRLISRIRHRQFGVLVTTSVISNQAYQEVRADRHPIIFLCGKDMAKTLVTNGYNSIELVQDLLSREFPIQLGLKPEGYVSSKN